MDTKMQNECETDAMQCTLKCLNALANKNSLDRRSRQYCLLLSRQDSISQQASQHLGQKVDKAVLIEAGYLTTPKIESHKHHEQTAVDPTVRILDTPTRTESPTMAPHLQFVAGNF